MIHMSWISEMHSIVFYAVDVLRKFLRCNIYDFPTNWICVKDPCFCVSYVKDHSCWSHDCLVSMAKSPTIVTSHNCLENNTYSIFHHNGCLLWCYGAMIWNILLSVMRLVLLLLSGNSHFKCLDHPIGGWSKCDQFDYFSM